MWTLKIRYWDLKILLNSYIYQIDEFGKEFKILNEQWLKNNYKNNYNEYIKIYIYNNKN